MIYQPALDGLRAVGIIAVIAYHVSGDDVPGGWAGVDLFFVLSGYLITTIAAAERNDRGTINLKSFYMRRVLRLTPALATLLVAEAVFARTASNRVDTFQAIAVSALYLMNWNRAFEILPQGSLGHTWSLATEEQFYLLWPSMFLALVATRRPKLWLGSTIVLVTVWRTVLVLRGASAVRTYNGFDTHVDSLLIGCLLALVVVDEDVARQIGRLSAIPAAAIAVVFFEFRFGSPMQQSIGLTLSALLSAWLLIAALQEGWLKRALSTRALVFIGKISYGLYLWHYPLLLYGMPKHPPGGALTLIALALIVSSASYYLIERPFLRLKRRDGVRDPQSRPLPSSSSP